MFIQKIEKKYVLIKITLRALFAWPGSYDFICCDEADATKSFHVVYNASIIQHDYWEAVLYQCVIVWNTMNSENVISMIKMMS